METKGLHRGGDPCCNRVLLRPTDLVLNYKTMTDENDLYEFDGQTYASREAAFKEQILESYRRLGRARTVEQGARFAWLAAKPMFEAEKTVNMDDIDAIVDAILSEDTLLPDSAYPRDEANAIARAVLDVLGYSVKE